MHSTFLALALLALSTASHAAPLVARCGGSPCPPSDDEQCAARPLFPEFPTGNTALSIPEGQRSVAFFTCSNGSIPVNTANATLYDVTAALLSAPDPGVAKYQLISYGYVFRTLNPAYDVPPSPIGSHSFVPAPTPSSSDCPPSPPLQLPFFALTRTSCPGEGAGQFTGRRVAATPSPLSPPGANGDWVQLEEAERTEGDLAKTVFRTDVQGGARPRNCSAGDEGRVDTVQYASLYWFLR
ncbi:hypothetical protein JCM10207_002874 [Rhodosporidiobolus poonsookiae]